MQEICGRAPCGARLRCEYAETDGGAGAEAAPCKQPAVVKKKQHGDAESHTGGVSITPRATRQFVSCAVHHHQLLERFLVKKHANSTLACRALYKIGNLDCPLCLGSSELTSTCKLTGAEKTCITNEFLRETAPARQLHC